jgi:hypothetical protein
MSFDLLIFVLPVLLSFDLCIACDQKTKGQAIQKSKDQKTEGQAIHRSKDKRANNDLQNTTKTTND